MVLICQSEKFSSEPARAVGQNEKKKKKKIDRNTSSRCATDCVCVHMCLCAPCFVFQLKKRSCRSGVGPGAVSSGGLQLGWTPGGANTKQPPPPNRYPARREAVNSHGWAFCAQRGPTGKHHLVYLWVDGAKLAICLNQDAIKVVCCQLAFDRYNFCIWLLGLSNQIIRPEQVNLIAISLC